MSRSRERRGLTETTSEGFVLFYVVELYFVERKPGLRFSIDWYSECT